MENYKIRERQHSGVHPWRETRKFARARLSPSWFQTCGVVVVVLTLLLHYASILIGLEGGGEVAGLVVWDAVSTRRGPWRAGRKHSEICAQDAKTCVKPASESPKPARQAPLFRFFWA